ncbi:MAG: DNRLRE domain-containing protein, partial [Deltaproteobacteria bacterium]|nr:DNRLRE domain-containing protein [Deltaproteobacteria bacterium]
MAGGSATVDACGFCAGGTTNRNPCGVATLGVVADTWVSQASPASNYGTDTSMQVVPPWSGAPAGNVLVKFDLSSLPANAVIRSVTLTATASTGFAYGGDGNV